MAKPPKTANGVPNLAGPDNNVTQQSAVRMAEDPDDPVTARLQLQMRELHFAFMRTAKHLAEATNENRYERMGRLLNQLGRTSVVLADCYGRLKNAGRQTVVMKHVTINHVAQALVGNITTQTSKTQAALAQKEPAPMPVIEGNAAALLARKPDGADDE
jgi:hypothetical protein